MRNKQSHGKPKNTTLRSLLLQHQKNPHNEYTFNANNSKNSAQKRLFDSINDENKSRNTNLFGEVGCESGKKQGLFGRIVGKIKNREPLIKVQSETESQPQTNPPFDKVRLDTKPYKFCFQHPRTPRGVASDEKSQEKGSSQMEVGSLAQESKVQKVIIQSEEPEKSNKEKISVDFSFDDISQHIQTMKQAESGFNQEPKQEEPQLIIEITSPVQELHTAKQSIPNSPKTVLNSLLPKLGVTHPKKESFEIEGTKKTESRVFEQQLVSAKDIKIDFDLDLDFI